MSLYNHDICMKNNQGCLTFVNQFELVFSNLTASMQALQSMLRMQIEFAIKKIHWKVVSAGRFSQGMWGSGCESLKNLLLDGQ